ncbi:MAG: hypothetical protein BAJALOKI2v1_120073 [Promethearchaeota archaeon]|nr:MAG: hypothetical protein BAJALOKI2v1_120073 [Candidatus Lokiarchaeota archaeon]
MADLEGIYKDIKDVLKAHSESLLVKDHYIGSKAKDAKPAYHLYGTEDVSILGKDPQKTYIAGVIQQKNYVSFYFNPIYSHPESFSDINPELKRFLKGKSCFNLTKITPTLLREIEDLVVDGIKKYRQLGWI